LRSARAVRLVDFVMSVEDVPLAPIVLDDELGELEPAVVLVSVLVLPEALGVLVLPLVLPAAVLPPEGVPVVPIGVVWVLCWPAPTAGSLAAGLGGVLWANAAAATVRAARPAKAPLRVDAIMWKLLELVLEIRRPVADCIKTRSRANRPCR
jgi:hypothetical protein